MPGLVFATAGIIIAGAGLFVTLHQIGLLSNKEKPALVSSSSDKDTTKRLEVTAPAATSAKTTAPSKAKLAPDSTKTLVNDRQHGTRSLFRLALK